jgi:Domain of unknown function (DUF4375)
MEHRLLQPEPPARDGVAWTVFEHLADQDLHDPSAVRKMTHEQRLVFAINMLRQEVQSGGFDRYFRFSGGNSAPHALEAADILGPQWAAAVATAVQAMGSPYPSDRDVRERILDQLDADQLFDDLDQRWYDLEAEQPADERLDQFVWSHKASFFT